MTHISSALDRSVCRSQRKTKSCFGWGLLIAVSMLISGLVFDPLPACAQRNEVHFRYSINMMPGSIGRQQLTRGGPLPGYYQPVEIRGPQGCKIALHIDGRFEQGEASATMAGMLIGAAYRLKVTHIPGHEGHEIYPTVEVIDRLYPPAGLESRYPIPIQITQEELQMALQGQYVIRVIYLEDPATALPVHEDPQHQRYFEVSLNIDPLHVADQLGRPMAILRMGSIVPEFGKSTTQFAYGSPPLLKYQRANTPTKPPSPNTSPPKPNSNGQRLGPTADVVRLPQESFYLQGGSIQASSEQRKRGRINQ